MPGKALARAKGSQKVSKSVQKSKQERERERYAGRRRQLESVDRGSTVKSAEISWILSMEQIVAASWEYIGEYEHLYEQFETIELHRKKFDLLQKFYWLLSNL